MTALLVQLALGNLLASALLAGSAYLVHRRARHPGLAHLLWVLVLLKLVTPPILWLPLVPVLSATGGAASALTEGTASSGLTAPALALPAWLSLSGPTLLVVAWATGSLVVLCVSLWRIYRFDRSLRSTSRPAPGPLQAEAREIAARLGMRGAPSIHATAAAVSPMTWWAGGGVRVVLPDALIQEMPHGQLRWALAHELAHVKRRDHVVRWLEWAACVAFWWNPITWWSRRKLHEAEESSCDSLVLERLEVGPRSYARALLAVVELLSQRTLRPPAVATGLDGAGSLERRFALLVRDDHRSRIPRVLAALTLGLATAVLPLGLGQDGGPGSQGFAGILLGTPAGVTTPVGPVAWQDGYSPLSASLGTTLRPVAQPTTKPTGRGVERARRKLTVAERRISRAAAALERIDVAPRIAGQRLERARSAIRDVAKVLERMGPPHAVRRDFRKARQTLRRLTRAWGQARGAV